MKKITALLTSKIFWINVLIAFVVLFLLFFITLHALSYKTHHGEAVEVPDLIGMYTEEAAVVLQGLPFTYQIVDSVYDKRFKPGEITEQQPHSGSMVKKGRIIYLTINARNTPKIRVPDMRNLSLRQAERNIKAMGLEIDEIVRVPSEFADLVMDVKYNGEPLQPGTAIPEGSALALEVGAADNSEEVAAIPDLHGLNIDAARTIIREHSFVVGMTAYDVQPTESEINNYVIYYQRPAAGEWCNIGKRVDLWLSKDPNKQFEAPTNDEDFF